MSPSRPDDWAALTIPIPMSSFRLTTRILCLPVRRVSVSVAGWIDVSVVPFPSTRV